MAISNVIISLAALIGIYGLLAIGLNLKMGITGILDFGHVVFYLIGAYVTALLVLPSAETRSDAQWILGLNLPWLPSIIIGGITASIFAMIIVLAAIRLRNDYLAITLLGFSIVGRRIVQSESWLANGPDTLIGFDLPFSSFFPLPGGSIESQLLFGVIVFILWATSIHILSFTLETDIIRGDLSLFQRILLILTTLGIGYWFVKRAIQKEDWYKQSVFVGALMGIIGIILPNIVGKSVTALVMLGPVSIYSWVLGGILLKQQLDNFNKSDLLVTLGIVLASILAFVPLVVSVTTEILETGGLLLTAILLFSLIYGVYRLNINWPMFGGNVAFLQIMSGSGILLVIFYYFIISQVTNVIQGRFPLIILNEFHNVLWLLDFNGFAGRFDYSRFTALILLGTLYVIYVISERLVESPFGRTLQAIREDEDAATMIGKDTFSFKVQSMMIGSGIAGIAGGLAVIHYTALTHSMFIPRITFIIFLTVIIGGVGNNKGVILGVIIYWFFQQGTTIIAGLFPTTVRASIQALRLVVLGAFFILILYYRPEGILGESSGLTGEVSEE